jgi:hypothetical protein
VAGLVRATELRLTAEDMAELGAASGPVET